MDKSKLFEAVRSGRNTQTVDVFGHDVVLHEITAADLIHATELAKTDAARSDVSVIIAGCDDLSEEDTETVMEWPLALTRKLSAVVLNLSGLGEEPEGKSEEAPI